MTESYGGFAYIYDSLMKDVDYVQWVGYIEEIFQKNNIKPQLILELACGTGNVSLSLARSGYDMIGIDLSEDMLNVATQKAKQEGLDILFLHQDMTRFELYGTVDVILCLMDSVNYLTDKNQLIDMFRLVKNYLNPGGLFIFDINTPYKLQNILGDNTFVVDEEDIFYVWENEYDHQDEICEFYLNFFIKDGKNYRRVDEIHKQKAYSLSYIGETLAESGLDLLNIYGNFDFKEPKKDSERVFFVARKH